MMQRDGARRSSAWQTVARFRLLMTAMGRGVKRTETQFGSPTLTYYVRSSALGGKVITELDQSGQKQKSYVFAGGPTPGLATE
jgi:hypothetical protein